jgi:hypothetical protein
LDKSFLQNLFWETKYVCSHVVHCARGHPLRHSPHGFSYVVFGCLVKPGFKRDPSFPEATSTTSCYRKFFSGARSAKSRACWAAIAQPLIELLLAARGR